jgi:Zn-dependent protease with chaperone function
MAAIDNLYPPSPPDVPPELTLPTKHYQTRAVLVLFSLITFFGVYLLLVVGSALLTALLVVTCIGIIVAPLPALFFLFLVKGFFKHGPPPEKSFRVEITEKDHPKLYAFIEKLCAETGAPFPHRIFLSPEVNAAVFYNESVFSLFLPTPKNLLLGMGLVNMLNLSEFKAVLAHEFGHFAQNSMKLHRFVYTANRIIADMVFGRDWLDNFVERIKHQDPRIAVFAWVIWGIVWLFRKILEGCFYGINFLSLSLSRQMEFNADLVAVSVTGSDAIVHALARLDFASQALDQAFRDLRLASEHGLYTNDLFYHQNHAANYLRRVRKEEKNLGEPPALPEDPECSPDVFNPDDEKTPEMWSTHPSCYDREQNAKTYYIRCDLDDRSPWLLFDDPQALRDRISWKFYRMVIGLSKDVDLDDCQKVQRFIDEERAEITYDEKYHGMYDIRPINPGKIDELVAAVEDSPWSGEVLARVQSRLYGEELVDRMKAHFKLREEYELLDRVKNGPKTEETDSFKFRGKRYDRRDAGRLLKKVRAEMDEDLDWLAEIDRRVFRSHYQMAVEVNKDMAEELLDRYQFHLAVQAIDYDVSEHKPALEAAVRFLSNNSSQLNYDEFAEIRSIFRKAHDALVRSLNKADKLDMPKLKNVKEGEPLGYFLMDRKIVKALRPSAQTLTVKWINNFLSQISEVQEKIRRIHFKSMGNILALQEKVAARWLKELGGVPDAAAAEPAEVEAVEEAPEKSSAKVRARKDDR